jgi:hypothetical protein
MESRKMVIGRFAIVFRSPEGVFVSYRLERLWKMNHSRPVKNNLP